MTLYYIILYYRIFLLACRLGHILHGCYRIHISRPHWWRLVEEGLLFAWQRQSWRQCTASSLSGFHDCLENGEQQQRWSEDDKAALALIHGPAAGCRSRSRSQSMAAPWIKLQIEFSGGCFFPSLFLQCPPVRLHCRLFTVPSSWVS